MSNLAAVIIFSTFISLTICGNVKDNNQYCDQQELNYLDQIYETFQPPVEYTKLQFRSEVCSKPEKKFHWKREQLEHIKNTKFQTFKTTYNFKITDLVQILSVGSEIAETQFLKLAYRHDTDTNIITIRNSISFTEILTILCQGREITETKLKLLVKLIKDFPSKREIDDFLYIDVYILLKQLKEIDQKEVEQLTQDDHRKLWNCGYEVVDALQSINGYTINSMGADRWFLSKLSILTGPGITCEDIKKNINDAVNANKNIDVKFFVELIDLAGKQINLEEGDFYKSNEEYLNENNSHTQLLNHVGYGSGGKPPQSDYKQEDSKVKPPQSDSKQKDPEENPSPPDSKQIDSGVEIFQTFFNCFKNTNELCKEISTNRHQIFATFDAYNAKNENNWQDVVCKNIIKAKFRENPVIIFNRITKHLNLDRCEFDLSTKSKVLNTIVDQCVYSKTGTVNDFNDIIENFERK